MVEVNTVVAGTRVIPLYIDEKIIEQVEEQCAGYGPVVEIKPLASLRVGMVVTGSEIYKGRIEDRFSPVVKEKIENLGSHVFRKINVTDDTRMIAGANYTCRPVGGQPFLQTGVFVAKSREPYAVPGTSRRTYNVITTTRVSVISWMAYLGPSLPIPLPFTPP